ncbi:MAG: right-handed parallel beta-helix repeat-containing protein [Verrucomicrobiaceae bacterium]|nr:right-handed parallel beta-helix repeat-containing protein [Verrucomicrobiaceae bacterium]
MKSTPILYRLAAAALLFIPALAHGQGQLAPPGAAYPYPNERALNGAMAPVPSMKTLMQIDAGEHIPNRTAANTNLNGSLGHYVLANPGRYYLTENLDKRILITADNVTIDLGGFEVRYTGAGVGPIGIEAQSGVAGTVVRTKIINGRIIGKWSTGIQLNDFSVVTGVDVGGADTYGIKIGNSGLVDQCRTSAGWAPGPQAPGPGPHSGIFAGEAAVISSCNASGIRGTGIQCMDNSRVTDCTVNQVAGCGIVTAHSGSVGGCSVRTCGVTGFDLNSGSALFNSTAESCGGAGVHVRNACTLQNVNSILNLNHGFLVENIAPPNTPPVLDNATNFLQCLAQSNTGDGFLVTSQCTFTHCTADKNGTAGQIGSPPGSGDGFRFGNGCRLSNCTASQNIDDGFQGDNANTLDQNSALANGDNGIELTTDQNIVIRNTLRANTTAPMQPAAGAGGLAPTMLPSAPPPVNPFANFSL